MIGVKSRCKACGGKDDPSLHMEALSDHFAGLQRQLYDPTTKHERTPIHKAEFLEYRHHLRYLMLHIMFECMEIECSMPKCWAVSRRRAMKIMRVLADTLDYADAYLADLDIPPYYDWFASRQCKTFAKEREADVKTHLVHPFQADGFISLSALPETRFPFVAILGTFARRTAVWNEHNRRIFLTTLARRNMAATLTGLVIVHASMHDPHNTYEFARGILHDVVPLVRSEQGDGTQFAPIIAAILGDCIQTIRTPSLQAAGLMDQLRLQRAYMYLQCQDWLFDPHVFMDEDIDYSNNEKVQEQVMQKMLHVEDPCDDVICILQRSGLKSQTSKALLFDVASKYLVESNAQGLLRCALLDDDLSPLLYRFVFGFDQSQSSSSCSTTMSLLVDMMNIVKNDLRA